MTGLPEGDADQLTGPAEVQVGFYMYSRIHITFARHKAILLVGSHKYWNHQMTWLLLIYYKLW